MEMSILCLTNYKINFAFVLVKEDDVFSLKRKNRKSLNVHIYRHNRPVSKMERLSPTKFIKASHEIIIFVHLKNKY